MVRAKAFGFVLERNEDFTSKPMECLPQEDSPDTVDITRVPIAMKAADVFTADEMEKRIQRYAERAAQRLPLFESGPPAVDVERGQCWACDTIATAREMIVSEDWKSRYLTDAKLPELYCPACFGAFGWGDEDDIEAPIVPHQKRKHYPKKRNRLACAGHPTELQPPGGSTDRVPAGGDEVVGVQHAPVP